MGTDASSIDGLEQPRQNPCEVGFDIKHWLGTRQKRGIDAGDAPVETYWSRR